MFFEIASLDEPLLLICVEVEDGCKEEMFTQEGKMIVPSIYENITICRDGRCICSVNDGCDVLQLLTK